MLIDLTNTWHGVLTNTWHGVITKKNIFNLTWNNLLLALCLFHLLFLLFSCNFVVVLLLFSWWSLSFLLLLVILLLLLVEWFLFNLFNISYLIFSSSIKNLASLIVIFTPQAFNIKKNSISFFKNLLRSILSVVFSSKNFKYCAVFLTKIIKSLNN